ncbi:GDCCVxC domain-containing (seleno)protein [Methylocystis rosea]|uniref:GDCCVxC domain-containing (seleno)protein n=1 Tax=Methylocystis rosea TaxID=173366 RepID=UPI0031BADA75
MAASCNDLALYRSSPHIYFSEGECSSFRPSSVRCGLRSAEAMPPDACQIIGECKGCGALLRPKAGDCCVFCSYGNVPCPPIQEAKERGRAGGCCSQA